jgi:hypothetical protein
MEGDPPGGVEHPDHPRRGTHVDTLAHQLIGHRVVVAVGVDV